MGSSAKPEITGLLHQWQAGDTGAMDRLAPLVYDELRQIARKHMRRERANHTFSATGLVNEAFLNLVEQSQLNLESRLQFFAIASRVMRRVLIWYARRKNASKRGGGEQAVSLNDLELISSEKSEMLIELDEALQRLERLDERLCRVVECRYFSGLSIDETAAVLEISSATVKRDWSSAKAWLRVELKQ